MPFNVIGFEQAKQISQIQKVQSEWFDIKTCELQCSISH